MMRCESGNIMDREQLYPTGQESPNRQACRWCGTYLRGACELAPALHVEPAVAPKGLTAHPAGHLPHIAQHLLAASPPGQNVHHSPQYWSNGRAGLAAVSAPLITSSCSQHDFRRLTAA
jgi:hypothetical protein